MDAPSLTDEDREYHAVSHRAYRAAKAFVDASLRDEGRDPATTRICEPRAYAATVSRVYLQSVRSYATLLDRSSRSMPETGQDG